jgi:hypothetical protein
MNSGSAESTAVTAPPQADKHRTLDTIRGRMVDEFANRHGSAHEIVAVWRP